EHLALVLPDNERELLIGETVEITQFLPGCAVLAPEHNDGETVIVVWVIGLEDASAMNIRPVTSRAAQLVAPLPIPVNQRLVQRKCSWIYGRQDHGLPSGVLLDR